MRYNLAPLLIMILISSCILHAQEIKTITYPNGQKVHVVPSKPDAKTLTYSSADISKEILATKENAKTGERRIIVEFISAPSAGTTKSGRTGRLAALTQEHELFRNDLNKITQNTRARGRATSALITQEYKNVFNGFALTASSEIEDELRKLPYVKSVFEDRQVKADDLESSKVINADKVWANSGLTGKNVVIGIIDTGIDYNHPDLGGGIGPGYKVIGGYDFVNNDNDPYDDHGHGTHVAGIAAANGSIVGVAPDAKLVAFKVLSGDGYGYDSWIVAAIERTVDPDQNPNTNDALDVVNMSLGRATDANEPYSQAVNNATLQGVTFAIAAGNSYNYRTVGTPGIAEQAITVAATDFSDVTAIFSSKGPTQDYRIKPDVAAPGVNIYSTFPGQRYEFMSGTSMASPHVAGAAALLLEKYPTWTPAKIKAALMNTAKEDAGPVWDQGAGRIDVEKAVNSSLVVSPSSISLGSIKGSAVIEKSFTLTVENLSATTASYDLRMEGGIVHPAINAEFTPQSVTLSPGQSQQVSVEFTIDPASLSQQDFKSGYFGKIVVGNDFESVRIPVALVNSPTTTLVFSQPLPYQVLFSNGPNPTYWDIAVPVSEQMELLVPTGTMDFIAMYYGAYVFQEDISTSTSNTVMMLESQAVHTVRFSPTDNNGNPIYLNQYGDFGLTAMFNRGWTIFSFSTDAPTRVSDNFYNKFEALVTAERNAMVHSISLGTETGQHASHLLENPRQSFTTLDAVQPFDNENYQTQMVSKAFSPHSAFTSFLLSDLVRPLESTTYLLAEKNRAASFKSSLLVSPVNGYSSRFPWNTAYMSVYENGELEMTDSKFDPNVFARYNTKQHHQTFGRTLLSCNSYLTSTGSSFRINNLSFSHFDGERMRGYMDLYLKTPSFDWGHISGFYNPTSAEEWQIDGWDFLLDPGPYSLKIDLAHNPMNYGSAVFYLNFDTQRADAVPPVIERFAIVAGDKNRNIITNTEAAVFQLELKDCGSCDGPAVDVADVALSFRKSGTNLPWQVLSVTSSQAGFYEAAIPLGLPKAFYDVRLVATDLSQNSIDYQITPGFEVGEPIIDHPRVTLVSPSNHYRYAPLSPTFSWLPVEGATSYIFQLSQYSTFDEVNEYSVVESPFHYSDWGVLFAGGNYYWRVKPVFENGEGNWSVTFDFVTRSAEYPTLYYPYDQSVTLGTTASFSWSDMADSYHLQIATDETFTVIEAEYFELENFKSYVPMGSSDRYYWRVQGVFQDAGSEEYGIWSDVFEFSTISKIDLLTPANNSQTGGVVDFTWSALESEWGSLYIFELSTTPDFSSLEENGYQYVYNPYIMDFPVSPATTYYWRVSARGGDGSFVYSDNFMFTTPDGNPFNLIAPSNHYPYAQVNPVFRWEDVPGASGYRIEVADNPQFFYASSDWTPYSSYTNFSFSNPNIPYYWRVRPTFGDDMGFWSETFDFMVRNEVPLLWFPGDGTYVFSPSTDLYWNGAASYFKVQVASDPSFTVDLREFDHVTANSMNLPVGLPNVYYWRVKSYFEGSELVEEGPWSQIFYFIRAGTVQLKSPSNGAWDVGHAQITFLWDALDGATTYDFEMSLSPDFSLPLHDRRTFTNDNFVTWNGFRAFTTYYWRVTAYPPGGGTFSSAVFGFVTDGVTGLPGEHNPIDAYAFPSPALEDATFVFHLSRPGDVMLEINDVHGKSVHRSGVTAGHEGVNQYRWTTHNVPGGIYLCKILSNGKTEIVKIAIGK